MSQHIGFVSTRFAGTDGVSLESAKWAQILWDHRHVSHWYSGMSDRDEEASMVVPHAYFGHADIEWINRRSFGSLTRTPDVTQRIYALADYLKGTLYEFTRRFDLDLLIVENALCIPMNVPLGVALTHFIAETGFPTEAVAPGAAGVSRGGNGSAGGNGTGYGTGAGMPHRAWRWPDQCSTHS